MPSQNPMIIYVLKPALWIALLFISLIVHAGDQAPDDVLPLEEAVSAYLDHVESYGVKPLGSSPKYGPLWKTYGAKDAEAETLKQVVARDNDYADHAALRNFRSPPPMSDELHLIVSRGLVSDLPKLRSKAAIWVSRHQEEFTPDQLKLARAAAVESFVDSDGEHGYHVVKILAIPDDRLAIRKLYNKVYAKQTHDRQDKPYQCSRYFFYHRGPTRGQLLTLLIRLGDRQALKEVIDAIEQDKDTQMRLWGWYMLEQVADREILRRAGKQIDDALSDKRIGNEPIDRDTDPEAKGPRLKADIYVRVCDIALRAIYACDPDRKKWAFQVPQWMPGYIGPWHSVHGEAFKSYDYKKAISPKVHNDDKHVFERKWVVGFTDDQIEHARRVAKVLTTLKPVQN